MVVWGSVVSQVTYLGRALCLYLFLKCSCDLRGRVLGTVCAVGWARSPGLAEDPHGRPASPQDPAQPFVPARSPRNLGVRPLTDPIRHAQGRQRGSRTAPPPSLCLRVAVWPSLYSKAHCCPRLLSSPRTYPAWYVPSYPWGHQVPFSSSPPPLSSTQAEGEAKNPPPLMSNWFCVTFCHTQLCLTRRRATLPTAHKGLT